MDDVRLIDANALEAMFLRFDQETDPLDADWFTTYLFVKDAETIDAVPVVRCKDCKHARPLSYEGYVACILWSRASNLDGFCHKGAKMDGDVEK